MLTVVRKYKVYLYFLSFFDTDMGQVVEILIHEKDKDPCILHNEYCGCWCAGNARSHGISNNGFDLVITETYDANTMRFNPSFWCKHCDIPGKCQLYSMLAHTLVISSCDIDHVQCGYSFLHGEWISATCNIPLSMNDVKCESMA